MKTARWMTDRRLLGRLWFFGRLCGAASIFQFMLTLYLAGAPESSRILIIWGFSTATALAIIWIIFAIGIGLLETKNIVDLSVDLPLVADEPPTADVPYWKLFQLESQLLQSRFDKFDSLTFQVRGWAMTLAVGATGGFLIIDSHPRGVPLLAAVAVFGFWWIEYRLRLDWNKYVARYRTLRRVLHEKIPLHAVTPMDLTDSIRRKQRKKMYSQIYGETIGRAIERVYGRDEQLLPASTSLQMFAFYSIVIAGLLAIPIAIRP